MRKPCLTCGKASLTIRGRCAPHEAARLALLDTHRGTAAQRGYGAAHRATRLRLLPAAYGTPCPRCKQVMRSDQRLDLGHTVALKHDRNSVGDRIEHATCNRGARF